jgi:hypothetical protein
MALVFFVITRSSSKITKSAFGRADGKEQIDHAHNRAVASQHEDTPRLGCSKIKRKPRNCFSLSGRKSLSWANNSPSIADNSSSRPRLQARFRRFHSLFAPLISKIEALAISE